MRKLILTTASVLALGLATSGAGFAQQPANPPQSPETSQPSANAPNQAPNAETQPGMQQGEQAQPQMQQPQMQQGEQTQPGMQQGEQSTAPVRVSRQQVRQVQQQLQTDGLYKGRIDGLMGPETRQAIAQFQQQNGLQNTGRLDQQTLAALANHQNNGTTGEGSNMAPGTQPSKTGNNNETGNQTQQPNMGGYQGQTQYK